MASKGSGDAFTTVDGEWYEAHSSDYCTSSDSHDSHSQWVGVGGWNQPNLEQIGTVQVHNDQYAFWEYLGTAGTVDEQRISYVSVHDGDDISATVYYWPPHTIAPGSSIPEVEYEIYNATTDEYWNTFQQGAAGGALQFSGATAETIDERHSYNGSPTELRDTTTSPYWINSGVERTTDDPQGIHSLIEDPSDGFLEMQPSTGSFDMLPDVPTYPDDSYYDQWYQCGPTGN